MLMNPEDMSSDSEDDMGVQTRGGKAVDPGKAVGPPAPPPSPVAYKPPVHKAAPPKPPASKPHKAAPPKPAYAWSAFQTSPDASALPMPPMVIAYGPGFKAPVPKVSDIVIAYGPGHKAAAKAHAPASKPHAPFFEPKPHTK